MANEPINANIEEEAFAATEKPTATPIPGLTATMEIAGAESIPGAQPDKIVLGFSRES